jgi:hypothetical protein
MVTWGKLEIETGAFQRRGSREKKGGGNREWALIHTNLIPEQRNPLFSVFLHLFAIGSFLGDRTNVRYPDAGEVIMVTGLTFA